MNVSYRVCFASSLMAVKKGSFRSLKGKPLLQKLFYPIAAAALRITNAK